jgi:hypothetical protein
VINNKLITIIIIVVFILGILGILGIIYCSKSYENYNYNKLDKKIILKIISKDCILDLRDYINILNSTENLKTIFLQDLCNNYICENYNPQNKNQLFGLIKTIVGKSIIKCILTNDIYRLALINLKINDMISSLPNISNYPIFKRALTNGVYGVEFINIYITNQQQSVENIVNLYLEKLPKLYLNEEQISNSINNLNLKGEDESLYRDFITKFINKIQSHHTLMNNKINKHKEFSIELFNIISTVTLYDLILEPSIEC